MADDPYQLAVDALRRLEDSVASVEPAPFGGVYTCSAAPSLATLNFVRVDVIDGPLQRVVTAMRAAARKHSLKTIVLDDSAGPMTNPQFEGPDNGGYWGRVVRGIYVSDDQPDRPIRDVEQIPLDEFIAARRAFFDASTDYDAAQANHEVAAVRLFAAAVETQYWGVRIEEKMVSVGELYLCGEVAQLESLSTLPSFERQGFGTAVTQARVQAAHAEGASVVFAQIEAGNNASIALHKRIGFTHVGVRNTFELTRGLIA